MLTPINEAEAIIEAFWDGRLSGLAKWTIDPGQDYGLHISQYWCWVSFEWQRRPASGAVLRMSRPFDVDCSDYDRLILSATAPKGSTLTLTAQTDRGQRTAKFGPLPGARQEHALELGGAGRIEQVALEITAGSEGPVSGWLNWIGLEHSGRLEHYLGRNDRFDAVWEGYLRPESYQPKFKPAHGLVLSQADLEALADRHREMTAQGWASPFVAAAQAAAAQAPERWISDHVNFWNDTRYCRQRDDGKLLLGNGPNAAVAAHLLRDGSLLRLAARYALSLASCGRWDDGFICHFPGSTFDHRCFVQSLCCYDVAAILDLAGEMFTPLGRDYLMDRLAGEGLADIQRNTWRYEYIFGCNQLAWFSPGRILALGVLQKSWPRTREYRRIACRELVESLDKTILPDGGYVEGPLYFRCVGRDAGLALYHHSRAEGVGLAEVTPEVMKRCGDFAEAVISTDESTDVIPICDAQALHEPLSQAMMAHACPASAWTRMFAKASRGEWLGRSLGGGSVPRMIDNAIAWRLSGSLDLSSAPPPRAFVMLGEMGVMASHRRSGEHEVKILIQGNKAGAGHCHEDKGSFVLEFAGQTFAMDPGTWDYSDPLAGILKSCQRHNMLVPAGLVQRPCPANPLPVDVKPTGHGDATSFHAAIDASPGWDEHYKTWRRTWDSPTPDRLSITDEYELVGDGGVEFLWQTRLPISLSGRTATITGRRGLAVIQAPPDCSARLDELPLGDGVQHCLVIARGNKAGTIRVDVTLEGKP